MTPQVPIQDTNSKLITIRGNKEKLVEVDFDGTVTIYEPGADIEAAEIFWRAIANQGHLFWTDIAKTG